jgi:hypothetical protein
MISDLSFAADAAAHELPDRVHHVGVVTPKAINPANDERVACAFSALTARLIC